MDFLRGSEGHVNFEVMGCIGLGHGQVKTHPFIFYGESTHPCKTHLLNGWVWVGHLVSGYRVGNLVWVRMPPPG